MNTDPQGRCYDGHHYKSELVWSNWEDGESFISCTEEAAKEEAEKRMTWWQDLNNYAVKERGEGARREYRVVKG